MSWTAPRTWVAGEVVTAALLNAQVRDNELILATIPTIATVSVATTTTYSKPTDCKWVMVELWGGGASGSAAGGGANAGPAMGAGGGGGAYCRLLFNASSLLATESVTVGSGGSGNSGDGNNGVDSTFKGMTAGGGVHGNAMNFTTGSTLANGGSGGTASGGNFNYSGDDGGKGQVIGSDPVFTNHGGGSPAGGGMTAFGGSVEGVGVNGKAPGGGGSGSYAVPAGGFNGPNGATGRFVAYAYFAG